MSAEKAQIAHFLEHWMRGKDAGLLPFIDVRIDLGGNEFLQAATQLLMLGREQHWRFLLFRRFLLFLHGNLSHAPDAEGNGFERT